jgi:hypothetical protein
MVKTLVHDVKEDAPQLGTPGRDAVQQLDDVDHLIEFLAVHGALALREPFDEAGVVEAGGAGPVRGAGDNALGSRPG